MLWGPLTGEDWVSIFNIFLNSLTDNKEWYWTAFAVLAMLHNHSLVYDGNLTTGDTFWEWDFWWCTIVIIIFRNPVWVLFSLALLNYHHHFQHSFSATLFGVTIFIQRLFSATLFGGHIRLVFTLVLFIFLGCVGVTLTSFRFYSQFFSPNIPWQLLL